MWSPFLICTKVQLFWEYHKNLRNLPNGLEIYLVSVQTMRKIAQIFVGFSEKLNFKGSYVGQGSQASPWNKVWINLALIHTIFWGAAWVSLHWLIQSGTKNCKNYKGNKYFGQFFFSPLCTRVATLCCSCRCGRRGALGGAQYFQSASVAGALC